MSTKTQYRYDRASIASLNYDDNGFFKCRVAIARPGVFPYLHTDGIRMEAKLPEEIFSRETIESAKGAPVTDGHPPLTDSKGMITPQNYDKYVKGALGDSIDIERNHIFLNETVFDSELIEEIKSGKKCEVSIGFNTDIDETPGELDGVRYDCIQRNIRINHVAHLGKGRGGSTVRAYFDSAISANDIEIAVMQNEIIKENDMPKPTKSANDVWARFRQFIRDKDDTNDPEEKKPNEPDGKDADDKKDGTEDSEKLIEEMQETICALEAQVEVCKAMYEKVCEELKVEKADKSVEKQDQAISERLNLIEVARKAIPDFKHDGLSNKAIKLEFIKAKLPFSAGTRMDKLTEARIDAQYDAALELARIEAGRAGTGNPNGGLRCDEAELAKMQEARLNMFKG